MEHVDDRNLALAARTEPEAFAELYRRHVRRVVGFAAKRSNSGQEVADVVATVFLRALEQIDRYDPERGEPINWLLGICANVQAGWDRRGLREVAAVERYTRQAALDADDIGRFDALIDATRLGNRLLVAMETLSPGQRAVFNLVALEALTPTEAAAALGIAPVTARVRLSRARAVLRRLLGEDLGLVRPALPTPSQRGG